MWSHAFELLCILLAALSATMVDDRPKRWVHLLLIELLIPGLALVEHVHIVIALLLILSLVGNRGQID